MAVYSQNGWPANNPKLITSWRTSNGVMFTSAKGDVETVLRWVAERFNADVETLHQPWGCWGYAPRNIRGSSTTLSNHASGTAIDCNAAHHPRGVALSRTFTKKQIAACRAIVHDSGGVIRWGGDYVSAPTDGMHFEINAGRTPVAKLANKITAGVAAGSSKEDDVPDKVHAWSDEVELVPGGKQSIRLTHESYDTGDHHAAGGYSLVTGPADVVGAVAVEVQGLPVGLALQVRVIDTDPKHGYKIHKRHPLAEVIGTAGGSFGVVPVSGHIDAGMHAWVQTLAPDELPAGCKVRVDADLKYWR